MTDHPAAQAIRMLEHGWPGRMTPETAALYLDGLGDLPAGALVAAVRTLLRTSEYRPSVALVRQEAGRQGAGAAPGDLEAMAQALELLRYREQLRHVNGSGYEAQRPAVHPAVERVCLAAGLTLDDVRWRQTFRAAWQEATINGGMVPQLGDGSAT
jgi:hypothetical protein